VSWCCQGGGAGTTTQHYWDAMRPCHRLGIKWVDALQIRSGQVSTTGGCHLTSGQATVHYIIGLI